MIFPGLIFALFVSSEYQKARIQHRAACNKLFPELLFDIKTSENKINRDFFCFYLPVCLRF